MTLFTGFGRREPTTQVCERMLLAGCIVQPTGDYKNVLKVKPPLVLTADSADYFAARLGETLAFFGVYPQGQSLLNPPR